MCKHRREINAAQIQDANIWKDLYEFSRFEIKFESLNFNLVDF